MRKPPRLAEGYWRRAALKFAEGDEHASSSEWPEAISSFQETVKFSLKATFLYVRIRLPRTHQIPVEKFAELKRQLPKSMDTVKVGNLYLISEIWSKVYLLAKYGLDRIGIPPEEIFSSSNETAIARIHAQDALAIATITRYETTGLVE